MIYRISGLLIKKNGANKDEVDIIYKNNYVDLV